MSPTGAWAACLGGLGTRVSPTEPRDLTLQAMVLGPQPEHMIDSGEVESRREQGGDLTDPIQLITAVAAGATLGAVGLEQSLLLVDAQHLWVDPSDFCSHRDREQGTLST